MTFLHRQWCLGSVVSEGFFGQWGGLELFSLAGRELVAVQGADLLSERFFSPVMPC